MGNLQCGSPLAKPCIGDTDIRYSSDATFDNLEVQSTTWQKYTGEYGPMAFSYFSDLNEGGTPRPPALYDLTTGFGWPYKRDVFTGFQRVVVRGSRVTTQQILIYGPAPVEFCSQAVPEGMANVVSGIDPANPTNTTAVCGVNGNVVYMERFSVSTYERDGRSNIVWNSQGPVFSPFSGASKAPGQVAYEEPVGADAIFSYVHIPIPNAPLTFGNTATFTDEDFTFAFGSGNSAQLGPNGGEDDATRNSFLFSMPRVADEAGFQSALLQAYREANIVQNEIPAWVVDADQPIPDCVFSDFVGGNCPTEEFFCSEQGNDPSCTDSIYQEPSASMKPGAIAGFCILALVVVGAIGYSLHRRAIKKQKKRLRKVFARQVAKRVDLRGSVSQLSPEDLAAEFKRIDKGIKEDGSADGFISRDELWDFVSSGKAGEISEKDFDALFDAMDTKGRGKVNFVEFAAFMSTCSDEVREIVAEEQAKGGGSSGGRGNTSDARLHAASMRLSTLKKPADENA